MTEQEAFHVLRTYDADGDGSRERVPNEGTATRGFHSPRWHGHVCERLGRARTTDRAGIHGVPSEDWPRSNPNSGSQPLIFARKVFWEVLVLPRVLVSRLAAAVDGAQGVGIEPHEVRH